MKSKNNSIISITIIAIVLFKKGPQLTIFFLLAFFSFLFSTISISSNIFSNSFDITGRENAFKIGLAIQVILLSVALSIRLKILQEISQKKFKTNPAYAIISKTGKAHNKNFTVNVTINEITGTGTGKRLKDAEQLAAKNVLEKLDQSIKEK